MTAKTWWFTPSLDHIDAQAHPVVLLDYKLAYLDVEGKPHPIVEGEGSLVVEATNWMTGQELAYSYKSISVAQERFRLLVNAQAELDSFAPGIEGVIAVSFSLLVGVSISMVPNNPPLFLSAAAMSALGWGAAIRQIVHVNPLRRNLNEALAEAKRELEAEGY